jgi:ectoine hydroxylase-related dioxygenase (phytanoyl-CoA dioxygenase family)
MEIAEFRATGVVVLRRWFDPSALTEEIDRTLAVGFRSGSETRVGSAGNEFQYVPMMCERTPVSLSMLDALAEPAAQLLARDVIPTRAKGIRYFGGTRWHRDSHLDVASVGFASYLEPLHADNGGLRVLKGSHQSRFADPPPDRTRDGSGTAGEAVATTPGDVIAFDEHLWHSSIGGQSRRQWRVDFVVDPVSTDEEAQVRAYFAAIFQPGWDGGYDVDRYPSYGVHWQASGRRWIDRLRALGVYECANNEEDWVRERRPRQGPS